MGIGIGMRAKDLQKFLMVARDENVTLLVRHTNEDSLQYVGRPGFYPKPAAIKAKTADLNPSPQARAGRGGAAPTSFEVAGLVVHPGFQPQAFRPAKADNALENWSKTMDVLAPSLARGVAVDLDNASTWAAWGVERQGVNAPRWSWKVDIDPASSRFGCLQLKGQDGAWCYIHGDYDLKDVIVLGREADNRRTEGTLDGVANFTPLLYERRFDAIQARLNNLIGVEMVQHGAEAQFAWHGDEPITVAMPGWRYLLLVDAATVQGWYLEMNREVLAKKGHDYRQDRSRMFHFGPDGMFAPGAAPLSSWGL